jgi:hypothetical protein
MSLMTLDSPMAKKMGRPKTGENNVAAKIDAETLRKAKIVAGFKDKTIAQYLTEVVAPAVDRDLRAIAGGMVDKMPKK